MFGDNSAKSGPPPVQPGPSAVHPANHMDPASHNVHLEAQVVSPTMPPIAPQLADAPTPYLDPPPASSPTQALDEQSSSYLTTGSGAPEVQSTGGIIPAASSLPAAGSDGLMKIKQQALDSLAPLVDKLQQPPEERFKTLMMMIQASDNSQYLDEAYAAANGISDEKDRAQALLDVVNEINYFTQQSAKNAE